MGRVAYSSGVFLTQWGLNEMSAQDNKFNPPASEMALLDHFAGVAMQSLVSHPQYDDASYELISYAAYNLAKAMLAEREKRNHAE